MEIRNKTRKLLYCKKETSVTLQDMQILDIDKKKSLIGTFNALVCLKENTVSIDKEGICQAVDKIGSSHHAPGAGAHCD